ncbi:MAG: lipopolysaccharide biosynthesis protein [Planctomycetes bacterium]|nr:lipopolysaccharide biosynthesis protein [Planctomycetota bacterium]
MLREAIKKLSQHALTYSAAEQLSRVAGFLLIPLFTHYLSEADYGTKELFAVTLAVLAQLCGINITNAMARHYFDDADPERKKLVVSTTWIAVVTLAGIVVLIFGAATWLVDARAVFGEPRIATLARLSLAILWFQLAREVLARYLQTEQRSVTFGVFSIAKIVCELGLQILFVAGLQRGLVGAFEAVALSEAVFATLLGLWILPRMGLRFSREIFAGLMAFALPLIPNGVLQFCLHSADRYFVAALAERDDVGVYALAYKLGYIGNYLLLGPFLMVWYPYVFSLVVVEKQKRVVAELAPHFLFVMSTLTLALSIWAPELVGLLAQREGYRAAAAAVPWIAFGYLFWGWFQFAQTGFHVAKATKRLPWLSAGAVAVNVIANVTLIPLLGFRGAAIATALTFALLAAATQIAVQSSFPHAFAWRRVLTTIGLAAGLVALVRGFAPEHGRSAEWIKGLVLAAWIGWGWWLYLRADERTTLVTAWRDWRGGARS